MLHYHCIIEVEHPITELVSGEDLVEHMLYIAAGQRIPKRLADMPFLQAKGSAIESRVYAEDPLRYVASMLWHYFAWRFVIHNEIFHSIVPTTSIIIFLNCSIN